MAIPAKEEAIELSNSNWSTKALLNEARESSIDGREKNSYYSWESFFGYKEVSESNGLGFLSIPIFQTNLTGLRSWENWAVIAKRTLDIKESE